MRTLRPEFLRPRVYIALDSQFLHSVQGTSTSRLLPNIFHFRLRQVSVRRHRVSDFTVVPLRTRDEPFCYSCCLDLRCISSNFGANFQGELDTRDPTKFTMSLPFISERSKSISDFSIVANEVVIVLSPYGRDKHPSQTAGTCTHARKDRRGVVPSEFFCTE